MMRSKLLALIPVFLAVGPCVASGEEAQDLQVKAPTEEAPTPPPPKAVEPPLFSFTLTDSSMLRTTAVCAASARRIRPGRPRPTTVRTS